MTLTNTLRLLVLFIFCSLFFACAEPSAEETTETTNTEDSITLASSSAIKPDENYYPIPAPDEMFQFIELNKVGYDASKNPEVDLSQLQLEKEKAIAFGLYSSNLAHVSAYDDVQQAIIYYKAIRQLANDLGIDGAMNKETMDAIQAKLDEPDSLMPIINNSYRDAVSFLEENKRGNIMAVVAASGWLESMHIVLTSVNYANASDNLKQRIADQKLIFGNLWAFLKKYEEDEMVNEVMTDLLPVRSTLAGFQEVKSGNVNVQKEGKKLLLGGGTKIAMTEEQFNELATAIHDLRKKMTTKNNS
jgi:hypothetical protein